MTRVQLARVRAAPLAGGTGVWTGGGYRHGSLGVLCGLHGGLRDAPLHSHELPSARTCACGAHWKDSRKLEKAVAARMGLSTLKIPIRYWYL